MIELLISDVRVWKLLIYFCMMLIVIGPLLIYVIRTKDETKRIIGIAAIYVAILLLVVSGVSIAVWGRPDPVIAYVPVPILEWSFIGGTVAVLYRLAFKENKMDTQLYLWAIAKPIIGLAMGALVYFIALGGSILLGNPLGNDLPNNTIYWLCALAFIGGFSDRFAVEAMDRFVLAQLKKNQDSDGNRESEVPDQTK